MNEPDPDARARFLIISLMRIIGVSMVLVGILIVRGIIAGYAWTGYVIIVAGLFDTFVIPQMLARKWRTPPPGLPPE